MMFCMLVLHVGFTCQYCDGKHHGFFSLDVSIVMKKYTAICSWACSWGCSHACSHLHTSTVMEQYTATCSRACSWAYSHSCTHLHKYK